MHRPLIPPLCGLAKRLLQSVKRTWLGQNRDVRPAPEGGDPRRSSRCQDSCLATQKLSSKSQITLQRQEINPSQKNKQKPFLTAGLSWCPGHVPAVVRRWQPRRFRRTGTAGAGRTGQTRAGNSNKRAQTQSAGFSGAERDRSVAKLRPL